MSFSSSFTVPAKFWTRARCRARRNEPNAAHQKRFGRRFKISRIFVNKGAYCNIVGTIRSPVGVAGTPLVKSKGGLLNGDSPPKMFTAAAVT